MRRRTFRRSLATATAAVAAGALVVLAPAAALADSGSPTDPVGSLLNQVQKLAPSGTPNLPAPNLPAPSLPGPSLPGPTLPSPELPGLPGGSAGPAQGGSAATGPTPSSDDDIAPNETTNPSGPDHAGTQGLRAAAAGQDVADAGQTRSTVRRDDSTRADSTLLALGGQEILGAHASSGGKRESHAGNPLQPLCDSSGGQVCLQVLYADAYATDAGGTSHALSRSGAADVCIGGTHADPTAACDGPVHAGVLTNSSRIIRNQHTGRTRASSRSDLATVCLTQPGTTGCALSAGALHSQGRADSGGGSRSVAPTAKRGSYLLGLQGGGQEGRVDPPASIQIPPGCPSSKTQAPSTQTPNVLCTYLNQGETYLSKGVAGHAQDALKAGLLPGQPVELDVLGGHTETLVHNRGAATSGPGHRPRGSVSGVSAGGPGHPATGTVQGESALAPLAGMLPNTGGPWSGLLALALLGISAGSFLVAGSQRSRQHSGRHLA